MNEKQQSPTLADLRNRPAPGGTTVYRELLRAVADPLDGDILLDRIEFPPDKRPLAANREEFAQAVCEQVARGRTRGGLHGLLVVAADMWPGNEAFAEWRRPEATPEGRTGGGCTVLVRGSHLDGRALLALATEAAASLNLPAVQHGYTADDVVAVGLPGATPDQGLQLVAALRERLRSEATPRRVELASPEFLDYALQRLSIVGPDQSRIEASHVPASTVTGDLIQAVISTIYPDRAWPRGKDGQPRNATADLERDGQQQRLDPDRTLHDNGVRDGDTLHIHPESTAGIEPRLRDEALARVRSQILAYAAQHEDFTVEANARHTPTEYVLRFRAPGWAPPESGGTQPVPIVDHVVFLALPEEFPMAAPLVFWQSPVFHPNIDSASGAVCLGELADRYRPGLDFGELCQTLRDIAAYRNFSLHEGFYNTAAAEWVNALENQAAIERRGGRSLLRQVLGRFHRPVPVRLRRIDG